MISIFENSTIFLKNGVKQFHEAILVTTKGIYTGTLKKSDEREGEFEEHCFIPRDQIEKITIVNEHGKIKEIEL